MPLHNMKDPKTDLPPINIGNSSEYVLGVVLFESGHYSIEYIRLIKVETSQFWINSNNILSDSPFLTFKRHSKNCSLEYHIKNYNSYKVLSWAYIPEIPLII